MIAAAAIGASYVAMMFVPSLSFFYTFVLKFGLSMIMLLTAFGFGSLQNYIRNMGAFYVINFVAAGGILGFHYLMQNSGDVLNGIWYSRTGGLGFELKIGFWLVVFGFLLSIIIYKTVIKSRAQKEKMTQYLADVRVWIEGEEAVCMGLIDTGNQLVDPLTRTPVMIMEVDSWKGVFPQGWSTNLRDLEADQIILQLSEEAFVWQDRLRIVPFRGVNRGKTQWMLALKPDKVAITHEGTTTESSRVLIGLDGGKLSADGSYQAIVHPALLHH